MQKHHNKKYRDPPKYSIGQLVWLENEDLFNGHSRNKFSPRFIGLLRIIDLPSPVNVSLELSCEINCIHPTFHIGKIKPYLPPNK
jgi:hypothetical protein